jgi:hypothetical protein
VLRRKRNRPAPAVPLADAVRGVAACPCAMHQDSFVASLAAARQLYLRVMEPSVDADPPADDQLDVATAVNNDGSTFLYSFTDLAAAEASNPGARFIAVEPRAAFRMSITGGKQGLLVTTAGPDDSWAAVTADGISRLLAGE